MKRYEISIIALALLAICYASENRTMFIHHGKDVDAFLYAEIDSIRFSEVALDSTLLASPCVQEIWTSDSVYRYDIAEIDSVSFQAPIRQAKAEALDLAECLIKYIESAEWDTDEGMFKIVLLNDTPSDLIPKQGQCIYILDGKAPLTEGFVGCVEYIYGNELFCKYIDLGEVFDTVAWTGEGELSPTDEETVLFSETPDEENDYTALNNSDYTDCISTNYISTKAPAVSSIPWLASENNYPQNDVMNDALRDIGAGTEKGKIYSKVRIQPSIKYSVGAYVIGGKTFERIYARVLTKIEASVNGRQILDNEKSLGKDKKLTYKMPLGCGKHISVSYSGTTKLKGRMGVDYTYSASYSTSALSTIGILDEDDAEVYTSVDHKTTSLPKHTVDAALDGEITLSGSLSLTMANVVDSLKSVTTTFTYGSKLSSTAFFLNSELDPARTSQELYHRLTASGVEAQPIENVAVTVKYAAKTLKEKTKFTPNKSETFYIVPYFGTPSYNDATLTWPIHGRSMTGHTSIMGTALLQPDKDRQYIPTIGVWPHASKLVSTIKFDATNGDIVSPTATLNEKTILASPDYPTHCSALSPLVYGAKSGGITITCGIPIIGRGSNGKTSILVGNLLTITKKEKK